MLATTPSRCFAGRSRYCSNHRRPVLLSCVGGESMASVNAGTTKCVDGFEYVFSYGSNSTYQLRQRVRSAGPAFRYRPAVMRDYSRTFAGWSRSWGGAVASVHPCPSEQVEGLVIQLTPQELEALDLFEGQYTRSVHTFWSKEGEPLRAWIYIKDCTKYNGPPSAKYLTAIHRMLAEGGHSTVIKICHIGNDGAVVNLAEWSLESTTTNASEANM